MQFDLILGIIFFCYFVFLKMCYFVFLKMCPSHQDQNEVPCLNSIEKSETEAGGYEERILTHGSNCHKSIQNYKLPWKPAQPSIRSASYKDNCLAAVWTDVIFIINNCGQR